MKVCAVMLKRPAAIVILLAFFVALAVLFVREDDVRLHGDGKEYVLLTVAFQRHFSFGVTDGSINSGTDKVAFDIPRSRDGKYSMCLYMPDAAFEPSGPDSSRGNFFGIRISSVTIRTKSH
jgi:hypothetical protein